MKKFGGEVVIPGNIIIRQRGTKYYPGDGVGMERITRCSAKTRVTSCFEKSKDSTERSINTLVS